MFKRLLRRPGVRAGLVHLAASYLRLVARTTRWVIEGAEHLPGEHALIVAFWHEQVLLMPELLHRLRQARPGRAVSVLASRHRDGRLIGAVAARFGVDLVHGSSSGGGRNRGGSSGIRQMLRLLDQPGAIIGLAPDGPRGPRRRAARGVIRLATASGAPLLPVALHVSGWRSRRSWDTMLIPLPFGRGAIVCDAPLSTADGDRMLARLEAALNQAADRAEALCRS